MSVQSARENAVLDALIRKAATRSEVVSALDGNGMPASPHGISDVLAGLVRRGLVGRSGSSYRITASGQASVRRRKGGYASQPRPGRAALTR